MFWGKIFSVGKMFLASTYFLLETVKCGTSVKAPLCCGRWSSQSCSDRWKTDSGIGEEGAWCQALQGVQHCAMRMRCECFWVTRRQCASWLESCRCTRSMCGCTLWQQVKTSMCNNCAWEDVVRGRCVCLHLPSIAKRLHFWQAKWHLWTKRKNYCSVQDNVCHGSQLRFDFQLLLGCQRDDEDECVVLEEG